MGDLRRVAAEGAPEELVDHLVEEGGVHLVAVAYEFVAHEVFDERGDSFEREADSTFVSQPRARSVGWSGSWRLRPERSDVFASEREPQQALAGPRARSQHRTRDFCSLAICGPTRKPQCSRPARCSTPELTAR
jgi:hypothetical protein